MIWWPFFLRFDRRERFKLILRLCKERLEFFMEIKNLLAGQIDLAQMNASQPLGLQNAVERSQAGERTRARCIRPDRSLRPILSPI